jgi:hypothetical protein
MKHIIISFSWALFVLLSLPAIQVFPIILRAICTILTLSILCITIANTYSKKPILMTIAVMLLFFALYHIWAYPYSPARRIKPQEESSSLFWEQRTGHNERGRCPSLSTLHNCYNKFQKVSE